MSDQDEDQIIPGKSSGVGLYVVGMAVMAAGIIGLLVWRSRSNTPPLAPATTTTAIATAEPPPPMFAPPPPPKIEAEPEPTATASPSGGKATGTGVAGPSPCGKCGEGESNGTLSSAVQAAAAGARGCYNRALAKGNEVSGRMTVSVQVGSNGAVCGASIGNDTVGSPQVSSCVLGRFQGRSFPPPTKGCVVVNVPINFTIKP